MPFSNFHRIEIELSSYCNRKCSWCINYKIDRKDKVMSDELFEKIIKELRDKSFSSVSGKSELKIITFSRFNEPMAKINMLKQRVEEARELLPNVTYNINTNGDYLNKENMDGLFLDTMHVSDYERVSVDEVKKLFNELSILFIDYQESEKRKAIFGVSKTIGKIVYLIDWINHTKIEDRAGHLKDDIYVNGKRMQWKNNKMKRELPCYEPEHYISIDYAGYVSPCCHILHDVPEHQPYIFGNVNDMTLEEIVSSKEWLAFQDRVAKADFPSICKYCAKVRSD